MLNIADKMRELIKELNTQGIKGVQVPIRPECEEQWSENYAIVQDLYWDNDTPYFDNESFKHDLQERVQGKFMELGDKGAPLNNIDIFMRWSSQEIEVHRKGTKVGED